MAADSYEDVVKNKESIPALEVAPQDLYHAKSFGLNTFFVKMQKLLEFSIV